MSSRVIPANYKEPNESTTSLGYALSILNGNTAEGGLRSLTYKSVYASQLIEESELAKLAVVPGDFQLLRIIEKDIATSLRLQQLRDEISSIKSTSIQRKTDTDEEIKALGSQLEQELVETKSISPAYRELLKEYQAIPSLNLRYTVRKMNINVKVQRMKDVKGFDSSMYQRAEERRAEEERARTVQVETESNDLAMAEDQDFDLGAQQTPPEGIFTDILNLNGLDQRDFDPNRLGGDGRLFHDADQVLMHDNFGGIGSMESPSHMNQQMTHQMQQQMAIEQQIPQAMDHDQLQHASHNGSPQINQMQPYPMDPMPFGLNNQGLGANHNQEAVNIGFAPGYPMPHNVDQYNAMNQLHGNTLDNPYMPNQPPF